MFRVFIENEADSEIKRTYNEKTLEYLFSEQVSSPYPYPYGFILDTTSGDGDNVDCFVITRKILKTGDIVDVEPVGLISQVEDGEVDHKIVGRLNSEADLPIDDVIARIQYFARHVFDHIPEKVIRVGEFSNRQAAEAYIRKCLD